MLPTSTIYHMNHSDWRDAELLGEHRRRNDALLVSTANFADLIFGQLCIRPACASGLATLCHSVIHVIAIGPKVEVGRIYTGGIVAIRAVVEHMKAIRDRPIVQLPRRTMSANLPPIFHDVSISLRVFVGFPHPTPADPQGSVNFFPEALFKRENGLLARVNHSGSTGARRAFSTTEPPSPGLLGMGSMEAKSDSADLANSVELSRATRQRAIVGATFHSWRFVKKVSTAIALSVQRWGILRVHSGLLSWVSRTRLLVAARVHFVASILPCFVESTGFLGSGGEL